MSNVHRTISNINLSFKEVFLFQSFLVLIVYLFRCFVKTELIYVHIGIVIALFDVVYCPGTR